MVGEIPSPVTSCPNKYHPFSIDALEMRRYSVSDIFSTEVVHCTGLMSCALNAQVTKNKANNNFAFTRSIFLIFPKMKARSFDLKNQIHFLWGQTLAVITYHKLHHGFDAEPLFTLYLDALHKGGLGLKIFDFHIEDRVFHGMPAFLPCVAFFKVLFTTLENEGGGQWPIIRNALGIQVPLVLYSGRGHQIIIRIGHLFDGRGPFHGIIHLCLTVKKA